MTNLYTYYKGEICISLQGLLDAEVDSDNPILKATYRDDGSFTYRLWSKWHRLARQSNAVTQRGGNGRQSLIALSAIPPKYQARIRKYGDPYKLTAQNELEKYIKHSQKAQDFFANHRKPNGEPLSTEKQRRHYNTAVLLNALNSFIADITVFKKSIGGSTHGIWQRAVKAVNEVDQKKRPHNLPKNIRAIQRKNKRYLKHDFTSLLHKGEGNENSVKIGGKVAEWILAKYSLPIKMSIPALLLTYIEEKHTKWPELTESAVKRWLNEPDQRRKWVLARHGKEAYVKEFGHHIKRDREDWFPNAWWAIDGSKLDFIHYFDNAMGMAAKLKIDPVIDVYSEKIIGWSYSETEDHTDHFRAIKMAVNETAVKPYLLTYDNQSGHKSGKMQQLYAEITATGGTHYPHKAYKKSNPIEQVFGRLQQQVINQLWFSDKQSIKARKDDSHPNMDFIAANKEHLLTREELEKAWEMCVQKWNAMPHPTFKHLSRNEVYNQKAPYRHEVSPLEMVSLFFIEENKGSRYKRGGLQLTVAKKTYDYEVYDKDGNIDLAFRRKYVGARFVVKYDPTALDQFIGLYKKTNDSEVLIAYAQPKRSHESIPILMKPGQKEAWQKDYDVCEQEYQRDLKDYNELVARTGISAEKLIEEQNLKIKMGGKLPKKERSEVESESFLNRI